MWRGVRAIGRWLRQHPSLGMLGFASVAVGIGANLALFSVTDILLHRSLPYRSPATLVHLHSSLAVMHDPRPLLPQEVAVALANESGVFDGVAWAQGFLLPTVPVPGENPLQLTPVSWNTLGVLGVPVAYGRDFEPSDEGAVTSLTVILSHESWTERFGRERDLARLRWRDGAFDARVVGVLPPGFRVPSSSLVARFDGVYAYPAQDRGLPVLIAAPIARLKPGVSMAAARAAVDSFMSNYRWKTASFEEAYQRGQRVTIQPIQSGLAMMVGPYLWLASAGGWALFAATCLNLAILLAVRAAGQQRQVAVMIALGAPRTRLVAHAFGEAAVVAVCGGCAAWIAWELVHSVVQAGLPAKVAAFAIGTTDARLLAVAVGLPLVLAVIASLGPVLLAGRADPLVLLRSEAKGWRIASIPAMGLFLMAEAAVSSALLVAAGSVLPAFGRQLLAGPGYEARDLFLAEVSHGVSTEDPLGRLERLSRAREIVRVSAALPHVVAAGVASTNPLEGTAWESEFWQAFGVQGADYGVTPGFFTSLGAPLRRGRVFTDAELETAASVAVINETGARLIERSRTLNNVVGTELVTPGGAVTVVGVVSDVRWEPGAGVPPTVFVPITSALAEPQQSAVVVFLRMASGQVADAKLLASLLDERFGPASVRMRSAEALLAPAIERPRFLALVFGSFAGIALLVVLTSFAALGKFEVIRSNRETSIRLALGASRLQATRRLLGRMLWPIGLGAFMGSIGANLVLGRWGTLLPEIQPTIVSFILAALAVVVLAALAGCVQIARIDIEDVAPSLK